MIAAQEVLWLSCAAKRCCTRSVQPSCGDIWRIAHTLQVPPASFLRLVESDKPNTFLLSEHGPRYTVALARRVQRGQVATCIFLLNIAGAARCGLAELRPLLCRAFPATGTPHALQVSAGLCTCRAWSIADLDRDRVANILQHQADELALDADLIATWNARIIASPHMQATFEAFCQYLFDEYTTHMVATNESEPHTDR